MKKLPEAKIRECVSTFLAMNLVKLGEEEQDRLVAVAKLAWKKPEPLLVKVAYDFLFKGTDLEQYRHTSVIDLKQGWRKRDYPVSAHVPLLMDTVFTPTYERILKGESICADATPAEVARQLGMLFRAIHPFLLGNRVLSWVIETQIRLLFGLPPEMLMPPKADFDNYRQNLFWPYVEKMKL
jgi:hypothetical protein